MLFDFLTQFCGFQHLKMFKDGVEFLGILFGFFLAQFEAGKPRDFFDFDNGGSAADWTATLDGLLTLDFDTAIPGHGPILRKADIRVFRSKLDTFMTRIKVLIDRILKIFSLEAYQYL